MIKTESGIVRSDMIHCALCMDAPCDHACENLNPSSLLRSIWFKNEQTAALQLLKERCIGCGRCALFCSDGGHQAIRLNEERKPVLDGKKCVGCHLCVLVCPGGAIVSGNKRVNKTHR